MILGERDRERIETAELEVQGLSEQLSEWRRRAKLAEGTVTSAHALVAEHAAYSVKIEAWAAEVASVSQQQVESFSDQAVLLGARLTTLAEVLRELHAATEDADGAICRHCGFAWPCPTLAAIPS